ncbi:unnamed protein product [Ambrosiozyma monospora]|uniref:Unnamed protein product n=1 Tax=Ambrosiozyma monospora TaxID=43982 RepID=A0ACB5T0H6_AMBMO|nr:unnamed protein product [Ambrosiozyma monospora]
MVNLLDIYCFAYEKHQILSIYGSIEETKFKQLADAAFASIVHILDMAIARHDTNVFLFDQLFERALPKVGDHLMEDLVETFDNFEKTWDSTDRALCRVFPLILKLSIESISDEKLFLNSADKLAGETLTTFISFQGDLFLSDQLNLMKNLELALVTLQPVFDDYEAAKYVVSWSKSAGLKGVGAVDVMSTNALVNKKRNVTHLLIITKLMCYSRFVRSFLCETTNSDARALLASSSLSTALDIIFNPTIDIDASRLGFGIILGVIETVFANEHKFTIPDNESIHLIFCRLMPVLCDAFNRYLDYCKSHNMFKPRRTFTQLFPTVYPFEQHVIDPYVKDESFCECLMELTVLIIICNKITCTVENGIVDTLCNSCAYSGNFAALDKYIGLTSEYYLNSLSLEEQQRNNNNLSTICVKAYNEIVHPTYYPGSKWLSLKAVANLSIAKVFNYAFDVALIPPPEKADSFDNKFWESFFYCSLKTITSKVSSIEHLNAIAAKACFNITGDIRPRLAESVYSAWYRMGFPVSEQIEKTFHVTRIGGLQKFMIEEKNRIIRSGIFMMAMQRDPTCVNLASKMSWDILVSEWTEIGNIDFAQREGVRGFYDIFFNSECYVPGYFGIISSAGIMFDLVKSAQELNQIPLGEKFDNARTSQKVKVSGYLMSVDMPELLQSLVNDMYESNIAKKNYVQAALSLELLANIYNWNTSDYVPACETPKFPAQSEFKRKEALFKLMAANFVKGGKVDQAIDTYNELLESYQEYNFDLNEMSFCHGELCKLYAAMENNGRIDSSYFYVSIIGLGFPESHRGENYILEGSAFEHITSINHRLARLYPGSRIIFNEDEARKMTTTPPFGKYIYIKTVSPAKSLVENNGVSFMTKQYIDNKNLCVFVSNRRIPGSTNICNLWTEEVTYETEMTFPTLMNKSEVKNSHTLKISPIKNAIKSLLEKNSELRGLEYLLHRNLKEGIDPKSIAGTTMFSSLSRVLAGTVDPPVNGGVGQYRAFFTDDSNEPDYQEDVTYLKNIVPWLNFLLRTLKMKSRN